MVKGRGTADRICSPLLSSLCFSFSSPHTGPSSSFCPPACPCPPSLLLFPPVWFRSRFLPRKGSGVRPCFCKPPQDGFDCNRRLLIKVDFNRAASRPLFPHRHPLPTPPLNGLSSRGRGPIRESDPTSLASVGKSAPHDLVKRRRTRGALREDLQPSHWLSVSRPPPTSTTTLRPLI